MAETPKVLRERTVGITGILIGILLMVLRVLDWISRGETLMSLNPYIHYLERPIPQIFEILLVVGLLIWATKLEQAREDDDVPRIMLPYGNREPAKPQSHWFWVKSGIVFAVVCLVVIGISARVHRTPPKDQIAAATPSEKPKPLGSSPPDTHPTKLASPQPQHTKTPPKDAPTQTSENPTHKPLVLNIPNTPVRPAGETPKVVYVAMIDNQTIKASSKPSGTLYVSLRVTSSSKYLGIVQQKDMDNVKEMLAKTGKITVFENSTGNYSISGNGLNYSINLTPTHARTIYFFDKNLESTCMEIEASLESLLGSQIACKFQPINPSTDPLEPNVMYDFLIASGLDMEIVL